MCGLGAVLAAAGAQPDERVLRAMAAAMERRGPDSDGVVVDGPCGLAFRRLAIMDPRPQGAQPMRSADRSSVLVFNGEVYGFDVLRRELAAPWAAPGPGGAWYPSGYPFRTGTDTEVVLAALQRWGEAALDRLNGMFALVWWDGTRLLAARDRFGIKPLHLQEVGREVRLASTAAALVAAERALGRQGPRPDPRALAAYLAVGDVRPGLGTFFEGVQEVPAGSLVRVTPGGTPQVERWWTPPSRRPDGSLRAGDAVEEFRALFLDSVRLQLVADVPLGHCLSGGLDSSAIAGAVARLRRSGEAGAASTQHVAVTAVFDDPGCDERPWLEAVLDHTGASSVRVTPTSAGLLAELDDLALQHDRPVGSSSVYAQWCVMRAARDAGVVVLLDGQGADELLGGYQRAVWGAAAEEVRRGDLRAVRARAGHPWGTRERPGPQDLVGVLAYAAPSSARRAVRHRSRAMGATWLDRGFRRAATGPGRGAGPGGSGTVLGRMLADDLAEWSLPALLQYEDRNSMAHAVEGRVPFLDHRLLDLVSRLPDGLLVRDGTTKWLIREGLADLLPEAVRARRPKLGFVTPELRWMREIAADVGRRVASGPLAGSGWVRMASLQPWFDGAHRWSASDANRAWRLASADAWLRWAS